MNRLFSPWRSKYIETYDKIEGCFLCKAYQSKDDEKNLVLFRGKNTFVIMNLFPYNAGHVMVCPNKHIGDFTEIDRETLCELSVVSQMMVEAIKLSLNPDGFNMGYNLGRVAGAGLETHIHNHIVPRWNGDTNFMPTIADVKVIPQDLKDIFFKIKKSIEKVKDRYVK